MTFKHGLYLWGHGGLGKSYNVIEQLKALDVPYSSSIRSYLQWEANLSALDWKDLISISVREAAVHFRHEASDLSMEEKRTQRRNIVREILEQTSDVKMQEQMYKEQTGASRADFFRKKKEVESGEFDEIDRVQDRPG